MRRRWLPNVDWRSRKYESMQQSPAAAAGGSAATKAALNAPSLRVWAALFEPRCAV